MELPTTELSGDLDLDGWMNGTCKITRTGKVYQRGDLITEIERLELEIEVAKKVDKKNRGLTDQGPEEIQDEIDRLSAVVLETALTVHVQDRTEVRRAQIRDRLVKENNLDPQKPEDAETIGLYMLADSIVKVEQNGKTMECPDGFPVNKLREMTERLGDAAMSNVWNAYHRATSEAPSVAAPLSRRSSSLPGGVT